MRPTDVGLTKPRSSWGKHSGRAPLRSKLLENLANELATISWPMSSVVQGTGPTAKKRGLRDDLVALMRQNDAGRGDRIKLKSLPPCVAAPDGPQTGADIVLTDCVR